MIREIHLVRHAPLTGVAGVVYGREARVDDNTPREAFENAAGGVERNAIWFASDYPRAIKTAGQLCAIANPDQIRVIGWLNKEPSLGEQNFGIWVGRRIADLEETDATFNAITGHAEGWEDMAPPGGESFNAFVARTAAGLEKLAQRARVRPVNAVAHGGTLRVGWLLATHGTPGEAMQVKVPHLSVLKLGYDDQKPESSRWQVISGPM